MTCDGLRNRGDERCMTTSRSCRLTAMIRIAVDAVKFDIGTEARMMLDGRESTISCTTAENR